MSETETGTVAVIDQTGRHHHFDADDWGGDGQGGIDLTKDGERVATFSQGHLGVYKVSARAAAPVTVIGSSRTAAAADAAIETLRREAEAPPSKDGEAGDAP